MTEEEAQGWIRDMFGGAAVDRMTLLADAIRQEAPRQNLVAPSTLPHLWSRHIVDSAQLVPLAAATTGDWLDIGTGAGFPGLVVAALIRRQIALAEPRARRVAFLQMLVDRLGLPHATVAASRVEQVSGCFAVVTARAVATTTSLFASAEHCTTKATLWLLPKGRSAAAEVALACETWHGTFHVEQSVTEPDSSIIRAIGVARR